MKTYIALFPLLLSTTAFAQTVPTSAPGGPELQEPDTDGILISATRLAIPVDRIAASLSILDKPQIDRAQDAGVTELLLRTPGISMSRNGGYGTATSLRIRGAETDQTVVVIDGVKLNDPSSAGGGYNFANLLTGDISRIEILRGPQSILWGSQAIGGVVNIVTPLPDEPREGSFDIEAGSRNTVSARAAVGGNTGPVAWRVAAQRFSTDGISAISPDFGGSEADGYSNTSVTGRVAIRVAEGVSADLRGYYSRGRYDFDATSADSPAFGINRELVGYAGLNFDMLDGRLRNRIGYAYTDTDRDNFDPRNERQKTFDAAGRNSRIEYQGTLTLAKGVIALFGFENEVSRFRSVSPPASLSRPIPEVARGRAEITSFYGELNVEPVTGLTLSGGVRTDDHSRYGSKTLFSAGAVLALSTGTTLRASYGEGFKAPTLYQLYSEYGNVTLDPERAHGWEAGAEQALFDGRLTFGAIYFERTTTNQIIYNSCSASSTLALCYQTGTTLRRAGYYGNVSRAEAHGVEFQAAARPVDGLVIDGNFSWVVADDRSEGTANFGNWLLRRPRHTANGSISYAWPFGLTTGAAIRWAGHSFDNASNAQRLDSYTLVDLRAEVAVAPQFTLFARAENLFDEDYMTAYRYGTLGRSIHAGIRGRL